MLLDLRVIICWNSLNSIKFLNSVKPYCQTSHEPPRPEVFDCLGCISPWWSMGLMAIDRFAWSAIHGLLEVEFHVGRLAYHAYQRWWKSLGHCKTYGDPWQWRTQKPLVITSCPCQYMVFVQMCAPTMEVFTQRSCSMFLDCSEQVDDMIGACFEVVLANYTGSLSSMVVLFWSLS